MKLSGLLETVDLFRRNSFVNRDTLRIPRNSQIKYDELLLTLTIFFIFVFVGSRSMPYVVLVSNPIKSKV
ncbi:hypothetical protein [Metabacillus fastidiosus]|uniref:hypothetical protein n=1 Tax=Metabacillus fastidiosus TaxID=1458 RepID=UPI0012E8707C|nr:hypothetical protein [Metabacillus fastidiosus]